MPDEWLPVSRPDLSATERRYLIDAFESSWISSSGKYLARFEEEFAALSGVKHALAVSNGTVALHLALTALGIRAGDEVIVPSLTYVATANAVAYCGAHPVFVDVTRDDWCIDVNAVEAAITERTRAVIAVHLYGHPADMATLRMICAKHAIFLIEDAAEAPFARRRNELTGGMGDVAAFSFYGNKVVTSGEGGAVTTNDGELARRMKRLRGQGMDPDRRYWFPEIGYNYRLTNLAAAILCGQLDRIDDIYQRRLGIYARYSEKLRGLEEVELQPVAPETSASPWLFSVLLPTAEGREEVAAHLRNVGIETRPFFIPIHSMPPYLSARRVGDLSVTTELSCRGLSLPTSSVMTSGDVDRVVDAVREGLRNWSKPSCT